MVRVKAANEKKWVVYGRGEILICIRKGRGSSFSENDVLLRTSLTLMVSNKLKRFATLQNRKNNKIAFHAFVPKMRLSRCLCFLVENRLGLATKSSLLHVIPTSTLSRFRSTASFVLRNLDLSMTFAFGAVYFSLFWETNHTGLKGSR